VALSESFRDDLGSSVTSIRLSAIGNALQEQNPTPDILEALKARSALEKDQECSQLLAHAIGTIEGRLTGKVAVPAVPIPGGADAGNPMAGLDAPQRLTFLTNLPRKNVRELAEKAPDWLKEEDNPVVGATIIRVFARHWPTNRVREISPLLLSPTTSLRLAALEVLIQVAPRQLETYLPKLLTAEDPRIHALAIRGLARIDPDEAVNHLQAMLDNPDREARLVALVDSIYFPFEVVKKPLLHFLRVEKDEQLIERGAIILECNPDPEVPFRLWELIERVAAGRARLLKSILQRCCAALQNSGVVEDFGEYRLKLQAWIDRRNAERFLQELVVRLANAGETERPELLAELEAVMDRPVMPGVLREMMKTSVVEPVRPLLLPLLKKLGIDVLPEGAAPGPAVASAKAEEASLDLTTSIRVAASVPASPTTAAAPSASKSGPKSAPKSVPSTPTEPAHASPSAPVPERPPPVAPAATPPRPGGLVSPSTTSAPPASPGPGAEVTLATFPELPLEEKIRCFSGFASASAEVLAECAKRVLTDKTAPPELAAAALRHAGRKKIGGWNEVAARALAGDTDALVLAAMEYLADQDEDLLYSHIGRLVQSTSVRVQFEAVRLLQKADPAQALQTVRTMLLGKTRHLQAAAVACMVHFDFGLVAEMLADYLAREEDQKQFEAGVGLFQGNPRPENLYLLFRLEKLIGGRSKKRAETLCNVRYQTEEQLVASGQVPAKDRLARTKELQSRLDAEKAAQTAAPKPYALKALQKESAAGPPPGEALGEQAADFVIGQGKMLMLGGVALLLLIGGTMFLARTAGEDSGSIGTAGRPLSTTTSTGAGGTPAAQTTTVPRQPFRLRGSIQGWAPMREGSAVLADDGRMFLILGVGAKLRNAPSGQRVDMMVVPFQRDPDGTLVASAADAVGK